MGKWLFAWQATLAMQAYFIHWLLAWLIGTTAAGVYAACMTVPLLSNPLVLGLSNALTPRAAQAFYKVGVVEVRRVIFQTTLLLSLALCLFSLIVLFWGEALVDWLYRGPQYVGQGHTVMVLTLAMLLSALGMPATNGLAVVGRPDVGFKAALVAVGVLVVLSPGLVVYWGVLGAAYGFLASNVVGLVGRWMTFLVFVRGETPTPARA